MAGFHTETDSFFKRGRKGYLFTLGDEPNLNVVPGEALEEFLGYEKGASDITAQEALQKAQEQYEVFHIHITNASHPTYRVENGWRRLVGDHFLTANSGEVANVIADTIRAYYTPEEDKDEELPKSDAVEVKEEQSKKEEFNIL